MVITKEDKEYLLANVKFNMVGGLVWTRDSNFGEKDKSAMRTRTGKGAMTRFRIQIGTIYYEAADIVWLLKTGRWPVHGIIFKDRNPRNLNFSNLKKRRKAMYVKRMPDITVNFCLLTNALNNDNDAIKKLKTLMDEHRKAVET